MYHHTEIKIMHCFSPGEEEKEVACFSPLSKTHHLGMLLAQGQVPCGDAFNSASSREDNTLWNYFKNISFTKVSNSIFRDREEFLAASTSLLA